MTTSDPTSVPTLRFREALDAVRTELEQLPLDSLKVINLEIPAAVMTTIGCAPQVRALRPRVADELPRFDLTTFDRLETYALAAGQAHAQHLAASAPVEPVQELFDELSSLREVLVSDVTALAKRKLLDGGRLEELRGPLGFKNAAFDVLLLCALLRDHWGAVAGRTGVQVSELDRAERLADRLATAVALRDQGATATGEAAELRQRAFTRFVSAYDQARRAIAYLRWGDGDIDQIIPSLYAGKARRKVEAATEVPTNGNGNGATPPVVTAPTPIQPVNAPAPAPAPGTAPTGMPGNDPFGR